MGVVKTPEQLRALVQGEPDPGIPEEKPKKKRGRPRGPSKKKKETLLSSLQTCPIPSALVKGILGVDLDDALRSEMGLVEEDGIVSLAPTVSPATAAFESAPLVPAEPEILPPSAPDEEQLTQRFALALPTQFSAEPLLPAGTRAGSGGGGTYLVFLHPMSSCYGAVHDELGMVQDGTPILVTPERFRVVEPDDVFCCLSFFRYWAEVDGKTGIHTPGTVVYTDPGRGGRLKEQIQTACLFALEDDVIPCFVRWRSTKCSAPIQQCAASDATREDEWASKGPVSERRRREFLLGFPPELRSWSRFRVENCTVQRQGPTHGLTYSTAKAIPQLATVELLTRVAEFYEEHSADVDAVLADAAAARMEVEAL